MQEMHHGVWILAEQSAGRLQRISYELLARGRELADKRPCDLTAVVLGPALAADELDELLARGADRVLAVESPALDHFLVEPHAACLEWLIGLYRPEIFLAGATSTGRTLMPYVAVRVHTGLTADCTGLDIDPATGNLLQTRPAIGGNIMATIQTPNHRPQMATIRPKSTPVAQRRSTGVPPVSRMGVSPMQETATHRLAAPAHLLDSRVRRVAFVENTSEHALAEADAVVAVGRGIGRGDHLPLAKKLADALDAALGATRDVVDRGWLSYPHQIGLSGKTVTPKLYVGLGVSGSVQHQAGMQTAETILAVNRDADAPIFRVADLGIVGNLFDIVPALTEKIAAAKKTAAAKEQP